MSLFYVITSLTLHISLQNTTSSHSLQQIENQAQDRSMGDNFKAKVVETEQKQQDQVAEAI